MAEPIAVISLRYILSLPEAQEGFLLASRGKSRLSQHIMQLGCLLIICWGLWLCLQLKQVQAGLYFVILGGSFLLLQLILRNVVLPYIFRSQYQKRQVAEAEQGIDISQQHIVLWHAQDQQRVDLSEVKALQKGRMVYVLMLDSGMVAIIPQRVVAQQHHTELLESIFTHVFTNS